MLRNDSSSSSSPGGGASACHEQLIVRGLPGRVLVSGARSRSLVYEGAGDVRVEEDFSVGRVLLCPASASAERRSVGRREIPLRRYMHLRFVSVEDGVAVSLRGDGCLATHDALHLQASSRGRVELSDVAATRISATLQDEGCVDGQGTTRCDELYVSARASDGCLVRGVTPVVRLGLSVRASGSPRAPRGARNRIVVCCDAEARRDLVVAADAEAGRAFSIEYQTVSSPPSTPRGSADGYAASARASASSSRPNVFRLVMFRDEPRMPPQLVSWAALDPNFSAPPTTTFPVLAGTSRFLPRENHSEDAAMSEAVPPEQQALLDAGQLDACTICLSAPGTHRALPCAHALCCAACFARSRERLDRCSLCRRPISGWLPAGPPPSSASCRQEASTRSRPPPPPLSDQVMSDAPPLASSPPRLNLGLPMVRPGHPRFF